MKDKVGYEGYRIAVPPAFEEVFSHFYFSRNNSPAALTQTLLPSYRVMMMFSFGTPPFFKTREGEEITAGKCLVAGPVKQAIDYTLPPATAILVANFKDDAFSRFFGSTCLPQHQPTHPDTLLTDNCFTQLWEELNQLESIEQRVNHILDFCKPYLKARDHLAEQIAGFHNNNLSPVKEISEKNNLSERAVQMSHKKHFGYSAKELNRYQRFLKAIEQIQAIAAADAKIDWFEIIANCGYYDQSQLIHDFKHYLNLSPSKYLRFQQDICNAR
ncbi:AraC family transcriptional regulator [Chitinophaga vietnamensis]|uniref:AraC family transcriptional regulator n=1 Tax=Chitinophaga vietnamensis TaxID=2593957 RepID=UPI0011788B26|nr:helix-turn-helix domain-containing protein [Chitinophaga vietnamensis]